MVKKYTMKPLIAPISPSRLAAEIACLRPLTKHVRSGLELYCFRAAQAPALMREVGRLREEAFRRAGGGTGEALDVDRDDVARSGYRQLIAWDAVRKRVVGGYRYIVGNECDVGSLSSAHYFDFAPRFCREFLPYAVELGRSFVARERAEAASSCSLFAMDALWQGLGRIVSQAGGVKYLFGKVTVYPDFGREATALLHAFLRSYFSPKEPHLIRAKNSVAIVQLHPSPFCGEDFAGDYRLLVALLRAQRRRIPPMINAYMKLSPALEVFDTALNTDFGGVSETAILLRVKTIIRQKRERYIKT